MLSYKYFHLSFMTIEIFTCNIIMPTIHYDLLFIIYFPIDINSVTACLHIKRLMWSGEYDHNDHPSLDIHLNRGPISIKTLNGLFFSHHFWGITITFSKKEFHNSFNSLAQVILYVEYLKTKLIRYDQRRLFVANPIITFLAVFGARFTFTVIYNVSGSFVLFK